MKFLFSIIIPVYNAEKYLERCLDSIVGQSYSRIEIILINDGSTDRSGRICDQYAQKDNRIKVIHQSNSGVSSARNAGLDTASGDYIGFVDADDWIENRMFEILSEYLDKKDVDVIRFNAERKGELLNNLPFGGEYSRERLENEVQLPLIGSDKFGGMFILGVLWLHIFKREIIEKNRIRFNRDLHRCEDRLFSLTVILHSDNILFVNDILYHYEVNEGSLSNKYDPLRWQQELAYLEGLKKEYQSCKNKDFNIEADKRLLGEHLLRAITSVNNEFFSDNKNNFASKYRNTKTIINNPIVKLAIKKVPQEKSGLKGKMILTAIKYRQPFLLSLLNIAIVYKNKLLGNG